jgi:hypothetical protein
MVDTLGGYCGASCDRELGCGTKHELQLHHNEGKTWRSRDVGPLKRIKLTVIDFLLGRLGVLCKSCNESDGGHKTEWYRKRKEDF